MICTDNMQKVAEKYDTGDLSSFDGVVFPLKHSNGATSIVIAVENGVKDSVIVHEIVHVKNCLYFLCGMELDCKNDEPEAYLCGWLAENIFKFFKNG